MARKPLDIIVAMHTQNDCYKKGTPATQKGVLFHSTAANNPYLRRYVDGRLHPDIGSNPNNNHWNMSVAAMGGRSVCVHAFIGYDINNKLRVAQILPYNFGCWGNGGGSKGSMNGNPHSRIQFEIQEDSTNDKNFLLAQLDVACQYAAELCIKYGWDPLGKIDGLPVILDHQESNAIGWGGNHGDIRHWLSKHGLDMNWVRNNVKKIMDELKGVTTVDPGVNNPAPPTLLPPTTLPSGIKEGDIVNFAGGIHYGNANATSGTAVRAGTAKVTRIVTGKYPIHLIGSQSTEANKSNVYGWVDSTLVTAIGTPVTQAPSTPSTSNLLSAEAIAREVIAGKWGNGDDRKKRLEAAGYNPSKVQEDVNAILGGTSTPTPTPQPTTKSFGSNRTLKADEVLKVKINTKAERYSRSTSTIPAKYKNIVFNVQQVSNDDVLIKELFSWVKKTDVEIV